MHKKQIRTHVQNITLTINQIRAKKKIGKTLKVKVELYASNLISVDVWHFRILYLLVNM